MKIERGDKVTIRTPKGTVVGYVVHSASNLGGYAGKPDCWYIECGHPNGGDARYWKQDLDGGTVELYEPPESPNGQQCESPETTSFYQRLEQVNDEEGFTWDDWMYDQNC